MNVTPASFVARVPRSTAPPAPPKAASDFVMVSLGDSLTCGTQDATTVGARQEWVYVKQLANAAGVPFNLPRVTDPGIPFEIFGTSGVSEKDFTRTRNRLTAALAPLALWSYYVGAPRFFVPPVWSMLGCGKREPSTRKLPTHNFAVAGFEARHLAQVRNSGDYMQLMKEHTEGVGSLAMQVPLIKAVLQNGGIRTLGSQVDQAVKAQPDLVVLWAGANDALEAVFSGGIDDRTLTPVEDRQWSFWNANPLGKGGQFTTKEVQEGFESTFVGPEGILTRLLRDTTAEIALLNVPDVAVIPNLMPLGQPVGRLPFRIRLKDGTDVTSEVERLVLPTAVRGEGKNGRTEFPPGSGVAMAGFLQRLMADGPVETLAEFQKAISNARNGLFSEWEVVDPDEIAQIRERIGRYNQILSDAAAANPRIHLVDVHSVMLEAKQKGRILRGTGPEVKATTGYTGVVDSSGRVGIFSFDGVHPSDTGHSVVANLVLDKIQQDLPGDPRFAAFVAADPVDERETYRHDPHRGKRQSMVLDLENIKNMAKNLPSEELAERG